MAKKTKNKKKESATERWAKKKKRNMEPKDIPGNGAAEKAGNKMKTYFQKMNEI